MKLKALSILAATALLAGCPDDDETVAKPIYTFDVKVENLTANQPLSPLAVLVHDADFTMFTAGNAASQAIEHMAEAGDNSQLLALSGSNAHVSASYGGTGIIAPGNSETVSFTLKVKGDTRVSLSSMLVNTNDAFIGYNHAKLNTLGANESLTLMLPVWDAGTEANSETAATVPGPAGGGEGFNAARNDDDMIALHSGVITADDGLATSALNASHRFLNPAAKVIITRTK
ncbi:spondin domain-containing protein [Thaumasiovibrio subtropicus]|uniref:spondin domain-containing protein n=1 Tax=Thaumasiovibrio subtropicus TaxID=1891207 RepID=UPI000B35C925|nr:spondin domain-containing protein [Thaumasiovibrio subtropicus]